MLFTILSVPILVLGFIVYKFKMVELLAGYNSKKVVDKNGLARWTGINLIFMAATNIIIDFILYIFSIDFAHKPLINIAVIIIFVVRIISGTKNYEK